MLDSCAQNYSYSTVEWIHLNAFRLMNFQLLKLVVTNLEKTEALQYVAPAPRGKIIILNISPEPGLHELNFILKGGFYVPRNNCKVVTFQVTYLSCIISSIP